jgi:hypothetical protein
VDGREQAHAAAAARTPEYVGGEHALQELDAGLPRDEM